MGTFSNWVGLMLVDSLWCNGREMWRLTSGLMLDSMRIGSLTPVSLGNERIPCDFSRVLVQPILKKLLFYLFYFPIGLVYMVLFGKASGFLIFMHISVYFYV